MEVRFCSSHFSFSIDLRLCLLLSGLIFLSLPLSVCLSVCVCVSLSLHIFLPCVVNTFLCQGVCIPQHHLAVVSVFATISVFPTLSVSFLLSLSLSFCLCLHLFSYNLPCLLTDLCVRVSASLSHHLAVVSVSVTVSVFLPLSVRGSLSLCLCILSMSVCLYPLAR